jgi:hypothetical protein
MITAQIQAEAYRSMNFPIYGIDDPMTIPSVKSLKVLDALPPSNKKGVIRYLLFMYDAKSPLRQIKKLSERKEYAIHLSGIKTKKEQEAALGPFLSLEEEWAVLIIYSILRIQNDSRWTAIVSYEKLIEDCALQILGSHDENASQKERLQIIQLKKDAADTMEQVQVKLDKLYTIEVAGDEELREAVQPYSIVTPEKIAAENLRSMMGGYLKRSSEKNPAKINPPVQHIEEELDDEHEDDFEDEDEDYDIEDE